MVEQATTIEEQQATINKQDESSKVAHKMHFRLQKASADRRKLPNEKANLRRQSKELPSSRQHWRLFRRGGRTSVHSTVLQHHHAQAHF